MSTEYQLTVIFKAAYSDVDRRLKKSEDRFELLKSHAESKLQEANETIANLQRRNQSELAKMHAMIREVHIFSNYLPILAPMFSASQNHH